MQEGVASADPILLTILHKTKTINVMRESCFGTSKLASLGLALFQVVVSAQPDNDAFSHRLTLTDEAIWEGTTLEAWMLNAGMENGEPNHGLPTTVASKSVWWTGKSPGGTFVKWYPTPSNEIEGGLAFYTGDSIGALRRVPEVAPGLVSVEAGAQYQIALWGSQLPSTTGVSSYRVVACGSMDDRFPSVGTWVSEANVLRGVLYGATREPDGEPIHGGTGIGPSVWMNYAPGASGTATLTLDPFDPGVVAAVYEGDFLGQLVSVGVRCGDNRIVWDTKAAARYRIAIAGTSSEAKGAFEMRTSLSRMGIESPANGSTLQGPAAFPVVLSGTVPDGPATLYAVSESGKVYSWAASSPNALVMTNPPRGPLTLLAIVLHEGSEYSSSPVYVEVHVPGDDFMDAIALSGDQAESTVDLENAGVESGEPGIVGSLVASGWWKWTVSRTGRVLLRLDERVTTEVYQGTTLGKLVRTSLQPASIRPDDWIYGWFEFTAPAGTELAIRAWEPEGRVRDATLVIAAASDQTNDDPSRPTRLNGDSGQVMGNNFFFAGTTPNSFVSAWYVWRAPRDGVLEVNFQPGLGAPGTSYLQPYRGMPVGNNYIRMDVWHRGFLVEEGQEYWMSVVGAASSPNGNYTITYALLPRPANDDYANRTVLEGEKPVILGSLRGATKGAGEDEPGIWYSWKAPRSGTATVQLAGKRVIVFGSEQWQDGPSFFPYGDPSWLERIAAWSGWAACFQAEAGKTYDLLVLGPDYGQSGTRDVKGRLILSNVRLSAEVYEDRTVMQVVGFDPLVDGSMSTAGYFYREIAGNPGTLYDGHFLGLDTNFTERTFSYSGVGKYSLYAALTNSEGEIRVTLPVPVAIAGNDSATNAVVLQGWVVHASDSTDGATISPYPEDPIWVSRYAQHEPLAPDYGSRWFTWRAPDDGQVTIKGPELTGFGPSPPQASQVPGGSGVFPVLRGQMYYIVVVGYSSEQGGWGNVFGIDIAFQSSALPEGPLVLEPIAPGTVIKLGEKVQLTARILADIGQQGGVEYWSNGRELLGWSDQKPFTVVWQPAYPGTYAISALVRFPPPPAGYGYQGSIQTLSQTVTVLPLNDAFAGRTSLSGTRVKLPVKMVLSSLDVGEPTIGGDRPAKGSLWWSWRAPKSGTVVLKTDAWDFLDVRVAAFTGDRLDRLAFASSVGSETTFFATAGEDYSIVLAWPLDSTATYASEFTPFNLILTLQASLPNDDLASRQALVGSHGFARGDNLACTREYGEPSHAGRMGGRSLWYGWVAPAHGEVTFALSGSLAPSLLAVYQGTSVADLRPVAAQSGNGTNGLAFVADQGQEYLIAVDGGLGAGGDFQLQFDQGAIASPVRLVADMGADGMVHIQADGLWGWSAGLEVSEDLKVWVRLQQFNGLQSATHEFLDLIPAEPRVRFYRVTIPQ